MPRKIRRPESERELLEQALALCRREFREWHGYAWRDELAEQFLPNPPEAAKIADRQAAALARKVADAMAEARRFLEGSKFQSLNHKLLRELVPGRADPRATTSDELVLELLNLYGPKGRPPGPRLRLFLERFYMRQSPAVFRARGGRPRLAETRLDNGALWVEPLTPRIGFRQLAVLSLLCGNRPKLFLGDDTPADVLEREVEEMRKVVTSGGFEDLLEDPPES